ncbi:fluoride efflux transporter CrcB [Metabacillus sp. GX 13764]|uniref:fluoride efflux transporter CrcB n=1 Tax=Metabacillus kandeliae TaxID=2900151 RepID=UPI001E5431BA|nr:fluoride efflux transporter CrcB [Metabacillus kandeliae]MCD7036335.1 fluoride efflux transporter CrcB [Metabacillus kandeliae]
MMALVLVASGGFFGAIARFSMSNLIKKKYPMRFPIATLVINLLGAFLLGFLIGKGVHQSWQLLLGTGFMGAFTTFSTFKLENIQLHADKKWKILTAYLLISYTFGILLAFLGMKVGGI